MTLHAAKGLEFREVYMVGMEEGTLPHHRSVAADGACDRRRAPPVLRRRNPRAAAPDAQPVAKSRRKWGKPRDTICSRFLYELTGKADNPNYLATMQGRSAKRKRQSKR